MDGNTNGMVNSLMNQLRNVRTFKSDSMSIALVFRRDAETR
jgi:hypothetical protein